MQLNTITLGDCREILATLPENSVDAVVTDPPYELGFMGKSWDKSGVAFEPETWRQVLRVLKPGGHLLAFGGSRTSHRITCAIEDAGFEIRDVLQWIYGSGFPKSLDVSKAIDKAAGAERPVVGERRLWGGNAGSGRGNQSGNEYEPTVSGAEKFVNETAPATDAAKQWQGWGTALKPAYEPIVMARKPLSEGTVAANVLAHGTGGINVDGCRIGVSEADAKAMERANTPGSARFQKGEFFKGLDAAQPYETTKGRWPANILFNEAAAAELDAQTGILTSGSRKAMRTAPDEGNRSAYSGTDAPAITGNSGGASRFFYCAKASRSERNAGLGDEFPDVAGGIKNASGRGYSERDPYAEIVVKNNHPTVKPLAVMEWLVTLVTPPGGIVLDPFTGSGSTLCAAAKLGFSFLGCELTPEYIPIAEARVRHYAPDTVTITPEIAAPLADEVELLDFAL